MSLCGFRVNYHGLRLTIYIKILVLAMLLIKDKNKANYSLQLLNKWVDREIKKNNRNVFPTICQLGPKQLGKAIANSLVCLQ